jgi:hypothetical protein
VAVEAVRVEEDIQNVSRLRRAFANDVRLLELSEYVRVARCRPGVVGGCSGGVTDRKNGQDNEEHPK